MKSFSLIFRLFVCAFLCLTTLSSCYSTKVGLHKEQVEVNDFPKFREMCLGQTHNQIVTSLGAPQRELPDGNGGTILIYENTTTRTISQSVATAYNINFFTRTYTPGMETQSKQVTNTDYIQYFVNSNNVCYEVKTNIPMTHTENREVYGPYKKFKKGLFWGVTGGVFAALIAVLCVFMPAE